jgi:ATP-dependent Clp protease ATP-binding subunit ClpC
LEQLLDYEKIKEKIKNAVEKHFKPEFINRLNAVVTFHPLEKEALLKVIELEINKLLPRLEKRHIYLELDKEAKEFLVEKGFHPEMGARPLRRTIEEYLEDPLADKLLCEPQVGRKLLATVKNGELVFEDKEVFDIPKPEKEFSKKEERKVQKA